MGDVDTDSEAMRRLGHAQQSDQLQAKDSPENSQIWTVIQIQFFLKSNSSPQ